MSTTGLLSIIVPVYNVEPYLAHCLDALLGQDYQHIEIILIDDGSTDHSLEICRSYAERDARIKLYTQSNQGLAVTRSHGLDYATGEFITFADSDDAVLPTTYSSALAVLDQQPACDQVQFPLHKRVGTPSPEIIVDHRSPIYGTEAMLHNWIVERDISWIVCNKIFRREAIGDLRFKAGFVYEDNLFVSQQLQRSRGICFSSEGAYLYYYRGGSITNTFTEKNMLDMIRIHCEIYDELAGYASLSEARGYMSYMIACDVFATRGWWHSSESIVRTGFAFLRRASAWELITARTLHPRRRLKALGIKLIAHLRR